MSFLCQEGACPLKKEDSKSFPFTSVSKYDSLAARLHFVFGNLSRVDVRQNTADKKSTATGSARTTTSFCVQTDFHSTDRCIFLCSKLYEVLKGWSHVGKRFLNVKSDEDIDDLMDKQVNM